MRLQVLEAIVQHAPLCLRVQRQPGQFFNLLAGAIAAELDMILNEMNVSQCRAARHETVWSDCRSQLRCYVVWFVGVCAEGQGLPASSL